MKFPNIKGKGEPTSKNSPFDPLESKIHNVGIYRYLFHDGKVAHEMDAIYKKDLTERHRYLNQEVEFSCMFPFTHGSSLAVNTALLLAHDQGLIPFTDSEIHYEMIAQKFQRIDELLTSKNTKLSGIGHLDPEKLRRIAFTMLDVMVPDEVINTMSIAQCLKYREASREAFERLKILIGELTVQIESEPFTEKFEMELQKLIHGKVFPEALKTKDKAVEVYEKLFGKLAKRAIATLTPTLGASVFAGLTAPIMLALSSAAALGAILPDLLDALIDERAARRNSLTYLLNLK
jgi:hypothetical protein